MDDHESIDKDVYRTTYSNGTQMIFNYRSESYSYKGKAIQPMKYIIVE